MIFCSSKAHYVEEWKDKQQIGKKDIFNTYIQEKKARYKHSKMYSFFITLCVVMNFYFLI